MLSRIRAAARPGGAGSGIGGMLGACTVTPPAPPVPTVAQPVPRFDQVQWSQVPGWNDDALTEAWPALLSSCAAQNASRLARQLRCRARHQSRGCRCAQRKWLESSLRAWRITMGVPGKKGTTVDTGRITGYYEPLLNGARTRGGVYQTPLYSVPDDLLTIDLGDLYPALKGERVRGKLQGKRVVPYPDRAQLADGKALAGKELVWVDSPIDAFFLQIQGSGRVQLTDGTTVRMAYADVNGQPFKSIGRAPGGEGRPDAGAVQFDQHPAVAGGPSGSPGGSAQQQSQRGVLPRGEDHGSEASGRAVRWACR